MPLVSVVSVVSVVNASNDWLHTDSDCRDNTFQVHQTRAAQFRLLKKYRDLFPDYFNRRLFRQCLNNAYVPAEYMASDVNHMC